jgi:hypothetical protein
MRNDQSVEALFNPGSAEDFFHDVSGLPPFDARATAAHSSSNAIWLAEFCRLTYRDERPGRASRESFIKRHGWEERRFFNRGGTQAGFFVNQQLGAAVLAFRGTSELVDGIVDLLAVPEPWEEGLGHVHVGFRKALLPVWDDIQTALREAPHPVFLVGHSLGAALATLTAALCLHDRTIPRPAALYTIGSPRVGNAEFVTSLAGLHHSRIVNDEDIVPQVPLPSDPLKLLHLYQHGGELHHIRHDGRMEVHAADGDVGTGTDLGAALHVLGRAFNDLKTVLRGEWKGALPEHLSDHAPVNYVYRLEDALAAETNAPGPSAAQPLGGRA